MSVPPRPEQLARDGHLCAVCGQWCGQKCERPLEWNSRFIAYAVIVHGSEDYEAVLSADRERHLGGRMTGFVIWARQQVGAWQQETKRYNDPLDHKTFDAWLAERVLRARVARQGACAAEGAS